MNPRKVHAVIASAKADWDSVKWDGDIWDDTDDEVDWGDLEEEEARKHDEEKHPPALQAEPLQRRQERISNGQRDFLVINEDYSQQEINDILSKFSKIGREIA